MDDKVALADTTENEGADAAHDEAGGDCPRKLEEYDALASCSTT